MSFQFPNICLLCFASFLYCLQQNPLLPSSFLTYACYVLIQTGLEKNLFGNYPVSLPTAESRSPPPAFGWTAIEQLVDTKEIFSSLLRCVKKLSKHSCIRILLRCSSVFVLEHWLDVLLYNFSSL
jgi:hypothetical protein